MQENKNELDLRIIRVSIEINDKLKIYEGLNVTASGTRFGNGLQNECEIKISNLDAETRNYILTETSPYNRMRRRKLVILEAGRQSYGVTTIFKGNIVTSTVSQPPDITVTLKCLTGNSLKGILLSRNQSTQASLKNVSAQVAKDVEATLDFQATDKQIGNYSYSGSALKQVDKLGDAGGVDAFIDNDLLIVKDSNVPLRNKSKLLDASSGLIGVPEITELGVKVKFLLDNITTLGAALEVKSDIYPAANGVYTIYKLSFEIANRGEAFYWIAEARRRRQ